MPSVRQNGVRSELRGCHSGVVHARDGEAHDDGAADLRVPLPAGSIPQRECDEQRRERRDDGDSEREREEEAVVRDVRMHLHRGHADVVHRADAKPHENRATQQPLRAQPLPAHGKERESRNDDRDHHREQRGCNVVADGNGQAESQHSDEMHGEHAEPHREGAADEPGTRGDAAGGRDTRGQIERRVGGEYRDQQGYENQAVVVAPAHPSARTSLIMSSFSGRHGTGLNASSAFVASMWGLFNG